MLDEKRTYPLLICEEGRYGYIDHSGNIIVQPVYRYAYPFAEGAAVVVLPHGADGVPVHGSRHFMCGRGNHLPENSGEALWQHISLDGRPLYLHTCEYVESFSDGVAVAAENGKMGYIDTTGRWVLPPKYDRARSFSNGLARVCVRGRWGIIDKAGDFVLEPRFAHIGPFAEGTWCVECSSRKQGYLDSTFQCIIRCQYRFANDFHYGLASVCLKRRSKCGYIDVANRWVIPPQFEIAGDFHEGLAFVGMRGKAGYIDTTGEIVVEPRYDDLSNFSEDLARVKLDGKWGFINKAGTFVIPPEYEYAGDFRNGIARVTVENRCGYIDRDNRFVWLSKKSLET